MGNFRELIGRDLPDSLEVDHHEMPIDRIGAFSRGSRMGTLLWRLKYGHDASCFKPAVFLLVKEAQLKSAIGTRLCSMAITEWLLPQCGTCNGARELIIGPKRIVCEDCKGYGVKRYSDRERDAYLGARFKPWRSKYSKALGLLTGNDMSVNAVIAYQLGH